MRALQVWKFMDLLPTMCLVLILWYRCIVTIVRDRNTDLYRGILSEPITWAHLDRQSKRRKLVKAKFIHSLEGTKDHQYPRASKVYQIFQSGTCSRNRKGIWSGIVTISNGWKNDNTGFTKPFLDKSNWTKPFCHEYFRLAASGTRA